MRVEIYEKNHKTQEVKFLICIEDVKSIEIVSGTAILRKEKAHFFDLNDYILNILNDNK